MSTSSNHSLYPHPALDAFADGFAGGILGGVTYLLFHSYFHLGGFEYSGWTLLALALTLGAFESWRMSQNRGFWNVKNFAICVLTAGILMLWSLADQSNFSEDSLPGSPQLMTDSTYTQLS